MAEIFEKDLPDFTTQNENFDMYGVWIKQKPKTQDSEILEFENSDAEYLDIDSGMIESTVDEIETGIEIDIPEITTNDEAVNFESNSPIEEGDLTENMQTDEFETFELDDFLNDDLPVVSDSEGNSNAKKENPTDDENKSEIKLDDFESADFDVDDLLPPDDNQNDDHVEPVKLDIEFDDSFANEQAEEQNSVDSFDDMLDELTGTPAPESNSDVSIDDFEIETVAEPSDSGIKLDSNIDIKDSTIEDVNIAETTNDSSESASFSQISFDELTSGSPQKQGEPSTEKDNSFEEISLDDFAIDDAADNFDVSSIDSSDSVPQAKSSNTTNDIDLNINVDDKSGVDAIQEIARSTSDEISNVPLFEDEKSDENTETVAESTLQPTVDSYADNQIPDISDLEKELNISIEETSSDDDLYFDDVNAVTDDLLDTETVSETNAISDTQDFDIEVNNIPEVNEDVSKITDKEVEMDSVYDTSDDTLSEINVNDISEPDTTHKNGEKPQLNDKSTELLMQIAGEISSIKTELSDLKRELESHVTDSAAGVNHASGIVSDDLNNNTELQPPEPAVLDNSIADTENELTETDTGFFTDDDSDETISLTGDELSNILITADFTEESVSEDYEIPEILNSEETFEPPVADGVQLDSSDEFDGVEIEPKYITPQSEDMSYLDEMSGVVEDEIEFDDTTIEIPEFDENSMGDISTEIEDNDIFDPASGDAKLSLSELDAISGDIPVLDLDVNNVDEDFAETAEERLSTVNHEEINENITQKAGAVDLPMELKEEIKSVLSYMDQLLESLPEEKIEEFAKSDHFSTYKKLFEDLGIS